MTKKLENPENQENQERLEDFDPKAFAEDFSNPDLFDDDSKEKQEPEKQEPEKKTGDEPENLETDPYLIAFKKNYEDVEIPKEVLTLPENERAERLFQMMKENSKSSNDDEDEFIKNYKTAKSQEGFSVSNWLNAQRQISEITTLSDEDLLKHVYAERSKEKKLNWSAEQIEAHIEAMTPIERNEKADAFRSVIVDKQKAEFEKSKDNSIKEMEKVLPEIQKETNKVVNEFIEDVKTLSTISGFKFSEKEKNDFLTELPKFTEKKLQEYNGEKMILSDADVLLSELLSDSKKSFALLPYLYLVKTGRIEGYASRLENAAKEKIIDKLDRSPERQIGQIRKEDFDPQEFGNM
jgi:hypothetical protein